MTQWVNYLQLLLVLDSAVILGPESSWTHDHTLLSQIQYSPNLKGQVPIFIYTGTGLHSYNGRHWEPLSSHPTTFRIMVEVLHTGK
jgi:hypothetical protein